MELDRHAIQPDGAAGPMGVEDEPRERVDDVEIRRADAAHVDDERIDERARAGAGRWHDDLLPIRRHSTRELIGESLALDGRLALGRASATDEPRPSSSSEG